MSDRMSIGQVGGQIMRYWPAILILVALVAAGAEVRLRVQQHDKLIDLLTKKFESRETDKAQWLIIRSLVEDSKELETRLKEVEKHITPGSIQRWGEIQWKVDEMYDDMQEHLRSHP